MGPRTRPAPTDQAADISGKAKASPASERFGRLERGSARGGVDSGQQTDHAADGWREQGSERVEHRRPDLIRRDTHHNKHADAGSEQSPHDTHGRTLNKKLCCDVAAGSANGTAQSDLR